MEGKVNYWNKNHIWEAEIELLKDIISKTELEETTKCGGIVYTFNKRNVVGLGGFKDYFTIWFHNGVFLKDKLNLLINAQEGVTKILRQWRFTSKDEINEKIILVYIAEAIENEKQGKISKPQKKESIVSVFFDNALKKNSDLNSAFEKFKPYKQKEFIEYIQSAKQEKTKSSRMEKIRPMIMENIGLNDSYRK